MGDIDDYVEVNLRYGGYWKKGKGSVVYDGGIRKKFTVEVDRSSLKDFTDEIIEQCPELFHFDFNLSYQLPRSRPPSYAWINTDREYMKMLSSHNGTYKVDVFLEVKVNENNEQQLREIPMDETTEVEGGNEIEIQVEQTEVDPCVTPKKFNKSCFDGSSHRRSPRLSQCTTPHSTRIKKTVAKPKRQIVETEIEGGNVGESHVQQTEVDPFLTPRRSPRLSQCTTQNSTRKKKTVANRKSKIVDVHVMEKMAMEKDEADECESQNSYQELHSSEDEAEQAEMVDAIEVVKSDDDAFEMPLITRDPPIHVGGKFVDKWEFRNEIRQHAIVHNFEAKFVKNEGKRFVIVCAAEKCEWRLRAIVMSQDNKTIEIRTLRPTHTCVGVNRIGNHQATADWIAKQIQAKVKDNRDFSPKAIADFLRTEFKLVNIPYGRLWLAMEVARHLVYGKVEQNYKLVPSLAEELKRRNPGSHVAVSLDRDGAFSRFFVSFGQCIEGFKNFCRPFLGVDGCHLKSKYMGVLLAATALDGNNGLYPVAFAVVEGESLDSWSWFLKNLNEALGGEIEGLTIMSDMEKGLEEALRRLMPKTEHRVCMRHLWKSIKKRHPGDVFERLVWSIAKSFNEVERRVALEELKETSVHAYSEICSEGRDKNGMRKWVWSRCDFNNLSRNHYITNNVSESFNAWVLDARTLPVCDLIDKIRGKMMKKFDLRKRLCQSWGGALTPIAETNVVDMSRNLPGYVINRANELEYEVDDGVHRNLVHVENKTCTCNRWQMTGLPCTHAMAVISGWRNPDWSKYVDNCFHKCSYEGAYAKGIGAMPSKEPWIIVDEGCVVGPPHTKRPRGRPKKERIRGEEEGRRGQVSKRVHKCTRCNGWGHHKNSCKNPINSQEQTVRPTTSQALASKKKKRARLCSEGDQTRRQNAEKESQPSVVQSTFGNEEVTGGTSSEIYVDPWQLAQYNISPVNPIHRVVTLVDHRAKRAPLGGKGSKSSKRLVLDG